MTHEDALQASIAEIIAGFFYATARGRLSHSQEINARNAAHLVWQRLEAEGQTNRWAAFTNDELWTLSLRLVDQHPQEYEWDAHALYVEVDTELKRRKDHP